MYFSIVMVLMVLFSPAFAFHGKPKTEMRRLTEWGSVSMISSQKFEMPASASVSTFFHVASGNPGVTRPYNIILTNDDGYSDTNKRALYDDLKEANCNPVLVMNPSQHRGSGCNEDIDHEDDNDDGKDTKPTKTTTWHFKPCPTDQIPAGHDKNASQPRIWYAQGPPHYSVEYGIVQLSPKVFGGPPDLVVSGVNRGGDMGIWDGWMDQTIKAARKSSLWGVAAIAFNARNATKNAWFEPIPLHSKLYAESATMITKRILESYAPYMPHHTYINVNFPPVDEQNCYNISTWKYALTRMHKVWAWTGKDSDVCGEDNLPLDEDVVGRHDDPNECWVSISVADAMSYSNTAGHVEQENVIERLGDLLTCFPRK